MALGRRAKPAAERRAAVLADGRPDAFPASDAGKDSVGSRTSARSAAASASAVSNPRHRRRARRGRDRDDHAGQEVGRGPCGDQCARTRRERQPGRELQRDDEIPRDSLVRRRRPDRVQPRNGRLARDSRPSSASQRSQSCSRGPHARAQMAQRGGTTMPSSSASIARDAGGEAHRGGARTATDLEP